MDTNSCRYVPPPSRLPAGILVWAAPLAIAQAQSSPFMTGATALQTNILAWLTPIAIILVMVLGAMAMANRMGRSGEGDPLWFVVDELDSLGAIDGLKDALARLRKFGGRCVLGFQSIAQVSSTYGSGEGQTIIENCGNTLILRCSGSEHGGTSQFASRLIGEREVVRRQISRAHDRGGWFTAGSARRSTTFSRQPTIETAVLAAEIEQLPDLSGFLKTAASPVWLRVTVRRRG
jgi:type IV secretory pathway TraG/TraD family ATPase VirD4